MTMVRRHPDRDGLLVCLVCDQPREQLGRHVQMEHGLSGEQYRAQHGLPAWTMLTAHQMACDLCGHPCRDVGRHAKIKHGLSPEQYRQQAGLPRDASLLAPAARVAEQHRLAAMSAANRARAAQLRQQLDEVARGHGYAGLRDLIERTASLPAREVGQLFGRSAGWIARWRGTFAAPSTAAAQTVRRQRKQRETVREWPMGVQPVRDDGGLLCRVCGVWRQELDKHLVKHDGLSAARYRARFGLADSVALKNLARLRHRDTHPWRRRYTERARAAGYDTVAALLTACEDEQAANLLGVRVATIANLRRGAETSLEQT